MQNVRKYINGFLYLIYPQNCVVCNDETNESEPHFCFNCLSNLSWTNYELSEEPTEIDQLFWGRIQIEKVYSMLVFKKNNATQAILHSIKHSEDKQLAVKMGYMLGNKILNTKYLKEVEAIVPIPIHNKKEFKRGYNQSMLICEGITQSTNLPIIELISRNRNHESQTKKDRFERWENVETIFSLNRKVNAPNHIALVDDVLTTGSTLEAAAKTIKEQFPNIKISIYTIAVAQ